MSRKPEHQQTTATAGDRSEVSWSKKDYLALAPLWLMLVGYVWTRLCLIPAVPWNAARLAPSYALNLGLELYTAPESGAQLGWVYGPVMPELYRLPALLPSLTAAMLGAGLLNLLFLLAPAWLVFSQLGLSIGRRLLLTGAFLLVSTATVFGGNALTFVHVDAPCIAFAVAACVLMERYLSDGRRSTLHLAVACIVLSAWTKQLGVMIVLPLLLWLWREGRAPVILPFLRLLGLYGTGCLAAILLLFGPKETVFSVIQFHLLNGVRPFLSLTPPLAGVLPVILVGLWLLFSLGRGLLAVLKSERARLLRLLLWSALCLLPIGGYAYIKVGGNWNSVHSATFLLIGLLGVPVVGGVWNGKHRGSFYGLLYACVALIAWRDWQEDIRFTPHDRMERQLETAMAHPNRAYLPWNPLVTLVSDKRLYPFDDALVCLSRIGKPVSIEAVRSTVPPNPLIIYDEQSQSTYALEYFKKKPTAGPDTRAPQ